MVEFVTFTDNVNNIIITATIIVAVANIIIVKLVTRPHRVSN